MSSCSAALQVRHMFLEEAYSTVADDKPWCPAPRLFVSLGLPGTCTNHNQGSGLQSTVGRALATASCPRLHQRLPAYHEHLWVASEQTALTDAYSHLMGISAGAVCDIRVAVFDNRQHSGDL